MEVRANGDPGTVVGHIRVGFDEAAPPIRHVRFALREDVGPRRLPTLELQIVRMRNGYAEWFAFDANGVSMAMLRAIPDFTEVR